MARFAVVDLPQPLSPTIPRVPTAGEPEGDAVHRPQDRRASEQATRQAHVVVAHEVLGHQEIAHTATCRATAAPVRSTRRRQADRCSGSSPTGSSGGGATAQTGMA